MQITTEDCVPRNSIDLGFADPKIAVHWNDYSGQSLCPPVVIGALPIVRVSTSGAVAAFGVSTLNLLLESSKARSAWARHNARASNSVRSRCASAIVPTRVLLCYAQDFSLCNHKCFDSTLIAPLPRLETWSFQQFHYRDRYLLLSPIHSRFRHHNQVEISTLSLNPRYSTDTTVASRPVTRNEVTNCKSRRV